MIKDLLEKGGEIVTKENDSDEVISFSAGIPLEEKGFEFLKDYMTDDNINKSFYLAEIGTLEEFRGEGYASELVEELENKFKEKGFEFSVLRTAVDNTTAQDFYKSQGYVRIEGLEKETDIPGQDYKNIFMVKDLN